MSRFEKDAVLVPFKENVTLTCENPGRKLRGTTTSGFRQCVYDPKPVSMIIRSLLIKLDYLISFLNLYRVFLIIGYLE